MESFKIRTPAMVAALKRKTAKGPEIKDIKKQNLGQVKQPTMGLGNMKPPTPVAMDASADPFARGVKGWMKRRGL